MNCWTQADLSFTIQIMCDDLKPDEVFLILSLKMYGTFCPDLFITVHDQCFQIIWVESQMLPEKSQDYRL